MKILLICALILMLITPALAIRPVVTQTTDDMRPLKFGYERPYLGPTPPREVANEEIRFGEPDGETLVDESIGVGWYKLWERDRLMHIIDMSIMVLMLR